MFFLLSGITPPVDPGEALAQSAERGDRGFAEPVRTVVAVEQVHDTVPDTNRHDDGFADVPAPQGFQDSSVDAVGLGVECL